MTKQLTLDVDTIQENEVHQLIADVRYRYNRHYLRYPTAKEGDFEFGMTSSGPVVEVYTRTLGLILNDEVMRSTKLNSTKIQTKMTELAKVDLKKCEQLEILEVQLKTKVLPVFNVDYLLSSMMVRLLVAMV